MSSFHFRLVIDSINRTVTGEKQTEINWKLRQLDNLKHVSKRIDRDSGRKHITITSKDSQDTTIK